MSGSRLAIGIDIALESKGLDLVALDEHRQVVASCGHLTVEEVARRVDDLSPDIVCIDSPPAWGPAGCSSRACERQLASHGISAFSTPNQAKQSHPFYAWMVVGFAMFRAVADDYPRYTGHRVEHTAAEVFPNASAVLLARQLRPPNQSKVRFRRRVLDAQGVAQERLPNLDRVDAALAALTGLIALGTGHCFVGRSDEGTILLPVPALPPSLRLRAT